MADDNKKRLVWDQTGERYYETGVDQGVLYVAGSSGYGAGVAWNGLTAINEKPSGAESNKKYADNIQYLNLISAEEFNGTIEAYTYPVEWRACDGQAVHEQAKGLVVNLQGRKMFGLCYRTRKGNDVDGADYGYMLHLVYGAKASTSEKNYETINDNPDAITFSWDFTTTPVKMTGFKPTSHLIFDSTLADPTKLAALEAVLYGKDPTSDEAGDGVAPRLPLPDEVVNILTAA